jgi:hypothetical protein
LNSLRFYSSENRTTFLSCFFWFFIIEACLGGSGRLIEFGGELTLRKVNFVIALFISLFLFLYFKKINKDIAFIFFTFLVTTIVSSIIGFINYGADPRVPENILMESFFLLLPFYSFFIKNVDDVRTTVKILKMASFVIAGVYLGVLGLIAIGVVDFLTIYGLISNSVEFMGRGENAFWFKGFLYLCLGLFFFDSEENLILRRMKQLVVGTAVYLTFTRGFVLAILITIFLHQLIFKSLLKSIVILISSIFLIIFLGQYYLAAGFNREDSDVVRKIQFQEVMAAADPVSIVIGHGFGKGVPIRDNHFEINYLEIFHKQGVIGLAFWFGLLLYICKLYINCKRLDYEREARPFLLAALFVYIQSATNPFLTNSIGLNMIMISIVSLNVYNNLDIKIN